MSERRLSPDKLLERVHKKEQHEKRGKLKIYLGAAPGVGKTHEMLSDALSELEKDLDIVIGVAESHGRQEIETMLKDFEVIPKKEFEYRGKKLLEFDLDAALKRHPGLILIDEMAHENVPGLRHKKRWQDIKELLDRGIDVYTTLNVQHIESLNDDVTQIINAPIKETVPDSMLEMADTIELVDIPPEELLKRLHEGKVYIPKQAALAAEHFFRKGNLTALRELALRTTADRVSAQVLLYRQDLGIKHIWPSREKILVCVGAGTESLKLIRTAKHMATQLSSEWIAVYVDRPSIKSSNEKRMQAIQNLRLAEQLGAETRVLTGRDIVKKILSFAHEENVTQIMIAKHIRNRWQNLFLRSLADEIVRNSGEIDVYIMTGTVEEVVKKKTDVVVDKFSWQGYAVSILIVGLATLFNFLLFPIVSTSILIMVYVLAVTIVALLSQMGPSILASILSVLAYAFFFIPPYYTIVLTFEYLITFFVMLVVTQVISQLTILTRRQTELAQFAEHQTSALYKLSRKLSSTRGIDNLLNVGVDYIANFFDCEVLALLPSHDRLVVRNKTKKRLLNEKEQSVAQWVYELGQKAGLGTDTLSFSDALYLPLLGSQNVIGVLRIHPNHPETIALPQQLHLLEACTNQIAIALEVDRLQEKRKRTEMRIETSKDRNALLQSISQDLRTPLVAIIGYASTQIEMANKLDPDAIEKLGKKIYFEAEQFIRLINNLLQLTYFEAEEVKLQKQLWSFNKLINFVVKKSAKKLEQRVVSIDVPDDLPLIPCDNTLIQEVLSNLIDNAIKFTPADTPIEISAVIKKGKIIVSVHDHGPGIMADEVKKLFEKFYRGRMLTEERGLGLGLAICSSIVKAHGGEIWAENAKDGGAVFRFTLPLK